MRRTWVGASVLTLAVFASATTHAQQGSPNAETLFQDARALVEKGNYAEACPKLAESQRLDPAVGTQFNLADCYEHLGRTATAYALFKDVASIARAAGKFEREKSAKERAGALEPRLARVHLVVASSAPGLEIRIDDVAIERARWDEALPVDPGAHRVFAAAPGRRSFEAALDTTEATTVALTIPELEETAPRRTVVVSTAEPARRPPALTYVAGGIGVAALATGAVAGFVALSKHGDAESACPKDVYAFRCPTEAGADAWNASRSAGDVSTIAFVVAGVALAGAAVLYFTAPRARPRSTAMSLLDGRF